MSSSSRTSRLLRPVSSLIALGLLAQSPVSYIFQRATVLGLTRWTGLPSYLDPVVSSHMASHDTRLIALPDTNACEDLHYDISSGMLFAASQRVDKFRRKWFPPMDVFADPPSSTEGAGDGTLIVIDPVSLNVIQLDLLDFDLPFVTHGIDIFPSSSSVPSIYIHAVNHLPNPAFLSLSPSQRALSKLDKAASQVEVFLHILGSGEARHIRSIVHEGITTPNDFHSIGPGEFYLTNDHHYREGPMRTLEDLGGARWGAWTNTVLVRADLPAEGQSKPDAREGVHLKVAIAGMHNNNGIGRTDDPEEIVLNSAAGGISSIGRKLSNGTISIRNSIGVSTTLDNPTWFQDKYVNEGEGGDASGLIMVGAAQAVPFLSTFDTSKATGVVWHVRPKSTRNANGEREWEEPRVIFQTGGKEVLFVTTAVLVGIDPASNGGRKQGKLFVTSAFGKAIVMTVVDL